MRRRIDEHQIEASSIALLFAQPRHAIGLHEAVLRSCKIIEREIALGPFQISARHIHGNGTRRASACRMNSRSSGVREQIQKATATSQLADTLSCDPMIEE